MFDDIISQCVAEMKKESVQCELMDPFIGRIISNFKPYIFVMSILLLLQIVCMLLVIVKLTIWK